MIVLDASVWVSSLLTQDVNHAISLQWTTQWIADNGGIVVPAHFLAEVGGAVSRPARAPALGRRAVADLIGEPAFTVVPVDQSLAEAAANLAADLLLRGADAVYVALAERQTLPLITWDNEQLTRAASVIDVRVPTIQPL